MRVALRLSSLEVPMHTLADYLFLGAVLLPPISLAVGFLILVSPKAIARAERTDIAAAKAH